MAITVESSPGDIRYSNGDLIWVVSSDKTEEKEFAYRIDIHADGSTILDEIIVKQANPTGNLIVNLSSIIDNELEPEVNALAKTTETNTSSVNSCKDINVYFGEQYQNSSGVLTNYTGAATETEGDNPAIERADGAIVVIKGTQAYNDLDPTDSLSFDDGDLLTDNQQFELNTGEFLIWTYWDGSDERTKHVSVRRTTEGTDNITLDNDSQTTYAVEWSDANSDFGVTHFIWWNEQGGWDQFSATEEETSTVNVNRESSQSSHILWGGSDGGIREADNENVFLGRTNKFRNTFQNTITKNTQWLTETESEHLEGLFSSRWTYIQDGENLIPVDIISGSYNVNKRTQADRLFNYEIRYRLSNDKRYI